MSLKILKKVMNSDLKLKVLNLPDLEIGKEKEDVLIFEYSYTKYYFFYFKILKK